MIRELVEISQRVGLIAGTLAVVAFPVARAADAPPRANARVVYVAPEKFTDVGDNGYVTTDERRDALLVQLKRHVEERSVSRIPAGSTLTVTITDIDMAGGFEWWRGPRADRIRIVKDAYPPRIKLAFTLDSGGKILAEGARALTDLSFMTNVEYRNDLLRYEKKLIDDWLEREFTGPTSQRADHR